VWDSKHVGTYADSLGETLIIQLLDLNKTPELSSKGIAYVLMFLHLLKYSQQVSKVFTVRRGSKGKTS